MGDTKHGDATMTETARIVNERYGVAAKVYEPGLCCAASYDPKFLKIIPKEVVERDYGCGDPSPYVREGDVVLDLGSGGGKLCFIMAQIVGPAGKVVGVEFNDNMLSLARGALTTVIERLGYSNVEFRKGRIEDMTLDMDKVDDYLRRHPINCLDDYSLLEELISDLRARGPLVGSESMDVVVSNCVLNLIGGDRKPALFREIHRVLKRGGRAVISDVVADEDVPMHLQNDPTLWGGCYSGAMREDRFLDAFAEAGMYGVHILERDLDPYHVMEGIRLRKLTVAAYKGKEGPCWDHNQTVVYKGPYLRVEDDDGHVFERGKRIAVCEKTFHILCAAPYATHFLPIEPDVPVSAEQAPPFPCGEPESLATRPNTTTVPRVRMSYELKQSAEKAPAVFGRANTCAPGCCT
jgi:arsenite methyltransferase